MSNESDNTPEENQPPVDETSGEITPEQDDNLTQSDHVHNSTPVAPTQPSVASPPTPQPPVAAQTPPVSPSQQPQRPNLFPPSGQTAPPASPSQQAPAAGGTVPPAQPPHQGYQPQQPQRPNLFPPMGTTPAAPAQQAHTAGSAVPPAHPPQQGYPSQPQRPQLFGASQSPSAATQAPHGANPGAMSTPPHHPQSPQGAYPQYPGRGGAPRQPSAHTQGVYAPMGQDQPRVRTRKGVGAMVGILIAAVVLGGLAGLGGAAAGIALWGNNSGAQTTASNNNSDVVINNKNSVNQISAVAAKVVPSVVTISVKSGSAAGTGSGVVLSDDGYVATNTHVVTLDGQTAKPTISVTDSNGHIYGATVVGTDPLYDLAVIKLNNASGMKPISFADSAKLNVGDESIAVGAPLGLSNTVTQGIVSALYRAIEIQSSAAPDTSDDQGGQSDQSPFKFDFGQGGQQQPQSSNTIKISVIQTDAAINPGNSGGALVDSEGNLIGINVAIAGTGSSSNGGQSGNIGVGFAIPSNIVQRITKEIISNGSATHALLGAMVKDSSEVDGANTTGAHIASVTPGGAADKAGLQQGDIITGFNGAPVTSAVDLTALVRAEPAGGTAKVTYEREGKSYTTNVTLGQLNDKS